MQQFYEWYHQLNQKSLVKTTDIEKKSMEYGNRLKDHLTFCDDVCEEISISINSLKQIEKNHTKVSTKSDQLHQACEVLLQEQVNKFFLIFF